MGSDDNSNGAMAKLVVAWVGTIFGGVTLSQLVLTATLIYTVLNIVLMVRKFWKNTD